MLGISNCYCDSAEVILCLALVENLVYTHLTDKVKILHRNVQQNQYKNSYMPLTFPSIKNEFYEQRFGTKGSY